ncbi:MAG: biotin--[acetyl-CoA-carboxylase] ligase [Thermoplasmatota archaeon]
MKTTREQILILLKKHTIISGEDIAEKLNISRTAVWKHIQQLKTKGYHIQSIKHKGYQLSSVPNHPIGEEVSIGLNTKIIGKNIHYFSSLPSTNSYAKTITKNKKAEGTVIIAGEQTAGRGRKKRTWHAKQGGLYFSIILHPNLPPQRAMIVTMAASIAVVEAINAITKEKAVIKWPNDVLIDGKKICGVLTEIDAEMDSIHYLIIGIGINVNNPIDPSLASIATNLKTITHSTINLAELLQHILNCFDQLYQHITKSEYDYIKKQWLSHTNIIGKTIQIQKEKTILKGTAIGITETGSLLIKTKKGEKQIVTGDVEYL